MNRKRRRIQPMASSVRTASLCWSRGRARAIRMRTQHRVKPAACGLPCWARRRDGDHFLPGLRGALQILLTECAHDTKIQQGLRVLRVDLQRFVELCQRTVRLVQIVEADTKVRTDIGIRW